MIYSFIHDITQIEIINKSMKIERIEKTLRLNVSNDFKSLQNKYNLKMRFYSPWVALWNVQSPKLVLLDGPTMRGSNTDDLKVQLYV